MSNWQEQQKQVATGVTDGSKSSHPEQEPVAYTNSIDVILAKHWTADTPPEGWEPLGYTTSPQRTKQEAVSYSGNGTAGQETDVRPTGFFFQMPQQKPVAWATQMGEYAHIKWGAKRPEYPMVYEIPLYTSPPQRTWVGLTDEETAELVHRYAFYELTRQIEAKLKEKNT